MKNGGAEPGLPEAMTEEEGRGANRRVKTSFFWKMNPADSRMR